MAPFLRGHSLVFGGEGYVSPVDNETKDWWALKNVCMLEFVKLIFFGFHTQDLFSEVHIRLQKNNDWSTYPPLTYPPQKNKALLRAYQPLVSLNKAL